MPERADDLAQIGQAIRCRLGNRVQDLQIWLKPHGLILSGCTSSYYCKQFAQHVARELSGIGIAENRIVVDSHLVAKFFTLRAVQQRYDRTLLALHLPLSGCPPDNAGTTRPDAIHSLTIESKHFGSTSPFAARRRVIRFPVSSGTAECECPLPHAAFTFPEGRESLVAIGQAVWLSSGMGSLLPKSPISTHRGLPAGESSTASGRSAIDAGFTLRLWFIYQKLRTRT